MAWERHAAAPKPDTVNIPRRPKDPLSGWELVPGRSECLIGYPWPGMAFTSKVTPKFQNSAQMSLPSLKLEVKNTYPWLQWVKHHPAEIQMCLKLQKMTNLEIRSLQMLLFKMRSQRTMLSTQDPLFQVLLLIQSSFSFKFSPIILSFHSGLSKFGANSIWTVCVCVCVCVCSVVSNSLQPCGL